MKRFTSVFTTSLLMAFVWMWTATRASAVEPAAPAPGGGDVEQAAIQMLEQNPDLVLQLVQTAVEQNPQLLQYLQQNPQLVEQTADQYPLLYQYLQQNPQFMQQLQHLLQE